MTKSEWVRCPVCGSKTRLQIRRDTELKNFPLYCPKCKQESLISQGLIPRSSAAQQTNDERSESRADTPQLCCGEFHLHALSE